MIPESITRWVLVGVAFGLSGYYLGANVYPILSTVGCFPDLPVRDLNLVDLAVVGGCKGDTTAYNHRCRVAWWSCTYV